MIRFSNTAERRVIPSYREVLVRLLSLLFVLLLCAPASAQVVSGGGSGLTVGAPIAGTCASGNVLFSNSGVLGCEAVGGTGTVTSITLATPNSSLTLGGTNPVTTSGTVNLDLNLSHANTWVGVQTFTTPILGTPTSGDASNFTNIPVANAKSGSILPAANGGAGTVSGALKGNGSGAVSQAACADLSNATAACSTSIGTSGAVLGLLSTANTWGSGQVFVAPVLGTPASGNGSNLTNLSTTALTGTTTDEICATWDSTTAVTAQTIDFPIAWSTYTIGSVKAKVAGGGSFTYSAKIAGTGVTSCNVVTVNSSSNVSTTCTGANTGSANDIISIVIASPSGTINQAYVCPVFAHTVN